MIKTSNLISFNNLLREERTKTGFNRKYKLLQKEVHTHSAYLGREEKTNELEARSSEYRTNNKKNL